MDDVQELTIGADSESQDDLTAELPRRRRTRFGVRKENENDSPSHQTPQPFATTRQNLIQAIQHSNLQALKDVLSSASDASSSINELEAESSNVNGRLLRGEWPITPLSLATQTGKHDFIELLLQKSDPISLKDAVKFEADVLLPRMEKYDHYFTDPERESWRRFKYSRTLELEDPKPISNSQSELGAEVKTENPEKELRGARWAPGFLETQKMIQHPYLRKEKEWISYENRPRDSTSLAIRSLLYTKGNPEDIFLRFRRHGLSLRGAQNCDIGRTLWFWAAQKGHVSILEALLEDGMPINFRATRTSFKPANDAPYNRPPHELDVPLFNTTALWNAAWNGAEKSVLFLLGNGALSSTALAEEEVRLAARWNALQYTCSADGSSDDDEDQPPNQPAAIEYLTQLSASDNYHAAVLEYNTQSALSFFGGVADGSTNLDELLAASQGLHYQHNLSRGDYADRYGPPDLDAFASVVLLLLRHGSATNPSPMETPATRQKWKSSPVLPVLLQCATVGATAAVKHLVDFGADLHVRCSAGKTLLHHAVRSKDEELVELALAGGISVDSKDGLGFTPMHECVLHGTESMLGLLIRHGADVNSVSNTRFSPLLIAANLANIAMARILLENGANPNQYFETYPPFEVFGDFGDKRLARSFKGGTPLIATLISSQPPVELVKLLLKHGADSTQPGLVAEQKRVQPSSAKSDIWNPSWGWDLQSMFPVQRIISFFERQFWSFDPKNWADLLEVVLDSLNSPIPQPMLDDYMRGLCITYLESDWSETYTDSGNGFQMPWEAIELLLNHGANPKVQGKNGLTLLHILCSKTDEDADTTVVQNRVRKLVELGLEVNATDELKRTPLHYAAVFCTPAIETLVELGADCSLADKSVRCPIEFACGRPFFSTYTFRSESVRMLLDYKTKYHIRWEEVLRAACAKAGDEDADLIAKIIRKGRDSVFHVLGEVDRNLDRTALHVACLSDSIGPLRGICASPRPWLAFRTQDKFGSTPLILAAQQRNHERVSLLIQAIRDSYDEPRITFRNASTSRNPFPKDTTFRVRFSQAPGAKDLGSRGVAKDDTVTVHELNRRREPTPEQRAQCLNMRDNHNWTALHYAARLGHEKAVSALVNDPEVDIGSAKGCCEPSPLELSYESGNAICVRLIQDALREQQVKDEERAVTENGVQDIVKVEKVAWDYGYVLMFVQRLEVRIAVALFAALWIWMRVSSASVSS